MIRLAKRVIPRGMRARIRGLVEQAIDPVVSKRISLELTSTVGHLTGEVQKIQREIMAEVEGVKGQTQQIERAIRDLATIPEVMQRLEQQIFATPYVNPGFGRAAPNRDPAGRFDYVGFEQKFRGPASMLEEKFRFYLPYVVGLSPIVDIGCGQGEFLSVLREAGISAIGVEIDPAQVAECRRKNLDVIQMDLFEYLSAVEDDCIGCLFSAQVIEHIPFERVNTLFRLAYRKLKSGGLMIAETVNPHCTAAFKLFWLDPTHVVPLFPEVIQFLGESVGFEEVGIVYPVSSGDRSRLYHECGEYAVVARKGTSTDGRSQPTEQ